METLTFNFSADLPRQQQNSLLAKVRDWSGVKAAQKLDPESDDPQISRMGFVELADAASAKQIKQRLAKLAGIENVETPAGRELID
jgi:hypothetical protein